MAGSSTGVKLSVVEDFYSRWHTTDIYENQKWNGEPSFVHQDTSCDWCDPCTDDPYHPCESIIK